MRRAPPVLVPVGRFVWGPRIAWGLGFFSAAILVLSGGLSGMSVGRLCVVALGWGVAALVCARLMRHAFLPPGELAWDGQGWWYRSQGQPASAVQVATRWDAGRALLLAIRARDDSPARHAWLQAGHMPLQWHGLRCALYDRDSL